MGAECDLGEWIDSGQGKFLYPIKGRYKSDKQPEGCKTYFLNSEFHILTPFRNKHHDGSIKMNENMTR